jgi:hypothetical protein
VYVALECYLEAELCLIVFEETVVETWAEDAVVLVVADEALLVVCLPYKVFYVLCFPDVLV